MTIARVLSIAGSDSGGGAGIQADLKTFTALGVYGMTAITAVTAQNTQRVSAVHVLPAELVVQQIDAVVEDIGVDAAKTGMLANEAIVEAVADAVERHGIERLVVDPVMIAKSGDALLAVEARSAIKAALLPRALIVTPNLPEAEALAGMSITDIASLRRAAESIHARGPKFVLIKGGHRPTADVTDFLFDGARFQEFTSPRIPTSNTHGTGCTLSAAIAAFLGRGLAVDRAVESAKDYLIEAIRHALDLGRGHGPLDHRFDLEGR